MGAVRLFSVFFFLACAPVESSSIATKPMINFFMLLVVYKVFL
jgi:hypothetical protein